jgi:ribosomal protein L14E/L6E/L27E
MDIVCGSVVLSVRGRDKDRCFAVIDTDGEYVFIADGRKRSIGKPKRKKIKHLKPLGGFLAYNSEVTNRELWRMLAPYRDSLMKTCGR